MRIAWNKLKSGGFMRIIGHKKVRRLSKKNLRAALFFRVITTMGSHNTGKKNMSDLGTHIGLSSCLDDDVLVSSEVAGGCPETRLGPVTRSVLCHLILFVAIESNTTVGN